MMRRFTVLPKALLCVRCRSLSRIGLCCVALLTAAHGRAAEPRTRAELTERIHDLSGRVARSPTANVTVVGPNRVENLKLIRWIAVFAQRTAQVTGLAFEPAFRELQVTVAEPTAGLPPVTLEQGQIAGQMRQRIQLAGYPAAYADEGRLTLVRAVLAVYLAGGRTTPSAFDAPDWLVGGLERNLDADDRSAATEAVLTAWESGRLGPVGSLITGCPALPGVPTDGRDAIVRAWQGALVFWLSMPQGKAERFQRLFDRLAAQQPVTTAWLFGELPSGNASDLDEAWDRWLLRQRGVVRQIGAVSTRVLDQLRAELLLYPGGCGIPLSIDAVTPLRVTDVIALRDEAWVEGFARLKAVRLEMLAAGRAQAFQDVVQAYCRILRGLLDGESETQLRRRAVTAESAFALLWDQVKQAGGLLEESQP